MAMPVRTESPQLAAQDDPQSDRRRRMGELLVSHGLLTEEQLRHALAAQLEAYGGRRRRLGQVVVDEGYLTEGQLA